MEGPGAAERGPAPAGGQHRQHAGSPPNLSLCGRGTSWLFSPRGCHPSSRAHRHPPQPQASPLTRGGRSSVPSSLCRRLEELIFSSSF